MEETIFEPVNQFYIGIDEENRIIEVQSIKVNDSMFLFTFPVGFDISNHQNYKIVNGELVEDPFVYPEVEPQPTADQLRIAELEETVALLNDVILESLM